MTDLFVWTDERKALLSQLWKDGESASAIAAKLGGTTRFAVIGKAHRMGLHARAAPSSIVNFRRPEGVDIAGLTDCMCRWPLGGPLDKVQRFCGKPVAEQAPYCALHREKAYRPNKPKGVQP